MIDNNDRDEIREKLLMWKWELDPEMLEFEEHQGYRYLTQEQVDDISEYIYELIEKE